MVLNDPGEKREIPPKVTEGLFSVAGSVHTGESPPATCGRVSVGYRGALRLPGVGQGVVGTRTGVWAGGTENDGGLYPWSPDLVPEVQEVWVGSRTRNQERRKP